MSTASKTSAQWYDLSINWSARTARELPVLTDLFGPPGGGWLLDAGCGTGRHVRALAELGYDVVGADASTEMVDEAKRLASDFKERAKFVVAPYSALHQLVGGGFHGVYCLGNALAAAGSREDAARAIFQFAECLKVGGRLFVQILNFLPMRAEQPCIRGPRIATFEGREYISWRHFCFHEDHAVVSNVTTWLSENQPAAGPKGTQSQGLPESVPPGGWQMRSHSGRLYPVAPEELRDWLGQCGMRIDHFWGNYSRAPFDPEVSTDLIAAATLVS